MVPFLEVKLWNFTVNSYLSKWQTEMIMCTELSLLNRLKDMKVN